MKMSSSGEHKTPKRSSSQYNTESESKSQSNSCLRSTKKKRPTKRDFEDDKKEMSSKLVLFKEDTEGLLTHSETCDVKLFRLQQTLLQMIFYSGYFSLSFVLQTFPQINKMFNKLTKKSISYLDIKSLNLNSNKLLNILSSFSSSSLTLHYIDLSYCTLPTYFDGAHLTLHFIESLKGFSLRGTEASDMILQSIGNMKVLKYLDISKTKLKNLTSSSQNTNFTAGGLQQLCNLNNLVWLNLSCTHINDAIFTSIINNNKNLEHLAVFGCAALSSKISKVLKSAKINLKSLDISHCKNINNDFFREFFIPNNNEDLIHNSFYVITDPLYTMQLFKCSYLPNVNMENEHFFMNYDLVKKLFPNLRHFEALYTKISKNFLTDLRVRQPSVVVIATHSDQQWYGKILHMSKPSVEERNFLLASELDNEYLSRHSNSLWRTTEIIRKWMQSEDYYYFKVDSFTLDMKKLTPFYRWPYQSVSY